MRQLTKSRNLNIQTLLMALLYQLPKRIVPQNVGEDSVEQYKEENEHVGEKEIT